MGRPLGPTDRGRAINLGDAYKALRKMVQINIVVPGAIGDTPGLRDQGKDEGQAEWGDTGGGENQGGARGKEEPGGAEGGKGVLG